MWYHLVNHPHVQTTTLTPSPSHLHCLQLAARRPHAPQHQQPAARHHVRLQPHCLVVGPEQEGGEGHSKRLHRLTLLHTAGGQAGNSCQHLSGGGRGGGTVGDEREKGERRVVISYISVWNMIVEGGLERVQVLMVC